jgi:succinate-acetate transporter protein
MPQYSDHDLEAQISHLSDDSNHFDESRYQKSNKPVPVTENNGLVYAITTSGTGNEYIHIDDKKFLKSDLVRAFGGTLNPGYSERPPHAFANPAPLGLSAFALTTFVLSLINCGAMGVHTPNIVVGLALFYGGFVQLLAGMWEVVMCNPFGATALGSFGGFWMSFGAIYVDFFGILGAYDDPVELDSAVGFYLLGWTIFTFGMMLLTMKSTVAFFGTFATLDLTFLLLAVGKLAPSTGCTKAAGVVGIVCAFCAWYCAYAGLSNHENSYIIARAIPLPDNIFNRKKKS